MNATNDDHSLTTVPATATVTAPAKRVRPRAQWRVPTALILLSLIPVIAGAARLTELSGGPVATPQNARFLDFPLPVVAHIVSVTAYSLLGAFQFVPSLRGRRSWHRIAGRILVPAGLVAALSGMWMASFSALPAGDGDLLRVLRLVFGSAMAGSIILGLLAILRRDFVRHSAWMTRGYAIALGAGTQALILIPSSLLFDRIAELPRALLMGAAWALNLGFAEFVIRRRARLAPRPATPLMRAAEYRQFGPPEVVSVVTTSKPTPSRNEVLVRVHASTVSAADHRARSRDVPRGLRVLVAFTLGTFRPRRRILGMDVAGVVEATGADVTMFAPGDEVIAMLGARYGGHAEYVCVPQGGAITAKPRNMTFETAVTLVFGGITARGFLNRTALTPGDTVLINGASGAVGAAAVQLAKHLGANVTAVCSSTNREMVTSLGADRVIDCRAVDFTAEAKTYNVIVDCVGNTQFERLEASIEPGGTLLSVITDLEGLLRARGRSRKSGKLVATSGGPYTAENLAFLVNLAETGQFRAITNRTYELSDIVDAHRFVDTGHKKGSVILRVAS